jgi:8-oxo-dGTP pyrophosphatase MutT (NUDIX family)
MPASQYVKDLRQKIGNDLLMMPAVSVALFSDDGRLLLGRRMDAPRWTMIGGAMDPGETPAEAAIREAFEETSLVVELTQLVGVYGGADFRLRYPNGDEIESVAILFEGRVIGGQLAPDGVEISELTYFTREQAERLPMSPSARVLMLRAFDRAEAFQSACLELCPALLQAAA